MYRVRNKVAGQGMFAAAIIAALAFGANQAAATAAAETARACSDRWCNNLCVSAGFSGGYCYGGYDCVCW